MSILIPYQHKVNNKILLLPSSSSRIHINLGPDVLSLHHHRIFGAVVAQLFPSPFHSDLRPPTSLQPMGSKIQIDTNNEILRQQRHERKCSSRPKQWTPCRHQDTITGRIEHTDQSIDSPHGECRGRYQQPFKVLPLRVSDASFLKEEDGRYGDEGDQHAGEVEVGHLGQDGLKMRHVWVAREASAYTQESHCYKDAVVDDVGVDLGSFVVFEVRFQAKGSVVRDVQ